MAVYVNNITVNTGAYFSRDFYLDNIDGSPLNLDGYSASSYIRKHPESLNPTAIFNVGFIDRTNGRIRVSLASTTTTTIKPGRYVYDVLFTDNTSKKSIVIEGNVLAREDISTECQFIKTDYLYNSFGIIPEENYMSGINNGTQITIDNIDDYGVVHIGSNIRQCNNFENLLSLLQNQSNLDKITSYIQNGGVVWFNVEWWGGSPSGEGCSSRTTINSILTLLGTEIRANTNDSAPVGNMTRSNEPSVIASEFPTQLYVNATATFSGGTQVYGFTGVDYYNSPVDNLRTVVYEKIGYGILYVSGDSNTFDSSLTNVYDLIYPNEFYIALRALVLNS
jgi:hypothetical protein